MVLTRQACSANCDDFVGIGECGVRTRASGAAIASAVAAASASTSSSQAVVLTPKRNLLELPPEIIMKILGFLPMRKVAETRLVCRRFNAISGEKLTSTFQRLQLHVLERFNSIKHQMPRRESARRHHPRAREADIMETLSMRLSLLQMAFGRHIQKGHICFFPGEILDEVQRILTCVSTTPEIGKAYKVTEELYDLSAMAMEYFKEKLEPTLPEISYLSSDFTFWDPLSNSKQGGSLASTSTASSSAIFGEGPSHPGLVPMPLPMAPPPPISWRDETESISSDMTSASGSNAPASDIVMKRSFRRIRLGMQKYNSELIRLRKDLKTCKTRVASQNKLLSKYHNRLDEYDKKFEENTKKFSTLIQELNKCKTELQYWRSKAPLAMEAAPRECEKCGHLMVTAGAALHPNDDSEDRRALAHQGIIVDAPLNLLVDDAFGGPSGSGLSDGASGSGAGAGSAAGDDFQSFCSGAAHFQHTATAGPSGVTMAALQDSSESENEGDFAELVAATAAAAAVTTTTTTTGNSKKVGKKVASQQQLQQHPMLGKRKRKSVDNQFIQQQPSCSHHQPAPGAIYSPPPPSQKNLRCKAAKQQAAAAGGSVAKTGGGKRVKLS